MEKPFHGVNSRSVIVLAEARGALARHARAKAGLRIEEYSPAEVKSAVTGSGRAEKAQVARMVGLLLGVSTGTFPVDATDALAVALCSSQRQGLRRLVALGATSK
jgi:crossover junction endodeoxyribonuclease RuvC